MAIPFAAALAATLIGGAMQYKASSDAQRRQNQAIQASLDRQRELQMKAEGKALTRAQEYEAPKRAEEQAQIEAELTQQLAAPVSESQQIRSEQQTTQGDVSQDYTTAKAKSDLEAMKNMQVMARLLGKTTSAGRLRMNEAIRLGDTGQEIDQLASFSRGQAGADEVAINQAGRPDAGTVLIGSILQGAGTAGLMGAGAGTAAKGAAGAGAANPWVAPQYQQFLRPGGFA